MLAFKNDATKTKRRLDPTNDRANDRFVHRVMMDAAQARACVNRFLLSQVGTQFCADEAELDVPRGMWGVPILLVTPRFVAGAVGEAEVNASTRRIERHTKAEAMYTAADNLRSRHRAKIKAAFTRARKVY